MKKKNYWNKNHKNTKEKKRYEQRDER